MAESSPSRPAASVLSWKGIFTGLGLSFFLAVMAVHSMTVRASNFAMDFSIGGAIALFFFLVIGFNALLRVTERRPLGAAGLFLVSLLLPVIVRVLAGGRPEPADAAAAGLQPVDAGLVFWVLATVYFGIHFILTLCGRSLALRRGELLLVYAMLACACSVCTLGFTTTVLPSMAGVYYYATAGNHWNATFHQHLPGWLAPADRQAIRSFFTGAPPSAGVDWGPWLLPLAMWTLFVMVLSVVMIAILVILRKQWVERERLVYPMAQLPLAMTEGDGSSVLGPFFRNKLMWIGFFIPLVFTCLNGLHYYFPVVPSVNLVTGTRVFESATLRFRVSFVMVGFAYLIKTETALSIWVFSMLALFQRAYFKYVSIASPEKLLYGTNRSAIQSHMGMGAIVVLVVYGLWVSRRHLNAVFRKAFAGARDVDDSDEIMSYRSAVLAMIVGLVGLGVWLVFSGVPWWAAVLVLLAALVLFLGITRIVAEVGLSNAVGPMTPPCVVTSAVGANQFTSAQLACLTPTFLWTGWMRCFLMAPAAQSLKLLSETPGRKRRAFWGILLAVLVAIVASCWVLIRNSYALGGVNFGYPYFTAFAKSPWIYMSRLAAERPAADLIGWISTGVGAAIMAVLIFLRTRLLWWPLAPIGFPLAGIWLMERLWFSVFLAWLIKSVFLKYGGHKPFKLFRPMFLGMILGQFSGSALWLAIDYFTGAVGNRVFWI